MKYTETILKIVRWDAYDVCWYKWYKEGRLIGLNFWHGEFDIIDITDGQDPILINIYRNVQMQHEKWSDDKILQKVYKTKMLTFCNH